MLLEKSLSQRHIFCAHGVMGHYIEIDGIHYNIDFIDHVERISSAKSRLVLKAILDSKPLTYVIQRPKEYLEQKIREIFNDEKDTKGQRSISNLSWQSGKKSE